jgi:hypothetical protein
MKRTHLLLSLAVACLMGTAYGTCYLPAVVCCFTASDSLGTFNNGTLFGHCTCNTGTSTPALTCSVNLIYADEEAWAFDSTPVSLGGRAGPGTSTAVFCDGAAVYNVLERVLKMLYSY